MGRIQLERTNQISIYAVNFTPSVSVLLPKSDRPSARRSAPSLAGKDSELEKQSRSTELRASAAFAALVQVVTRSLLRVEFACYLFFSVFPPFFYSSASSWGNPIFTTRTRSFSLYSINTRVPVFLPIETASCPISSAFFARPPACLKTSWCPRLIAQP